MKEARFFALYPGTFDPITYGHMDIIERAASIVDHLIIGIAENSEKRPLFPLDKRVAMTEHEIKELKKDPRISATIEVKPFNNLLMDFATSLKARAIIRGLRAVSDFEYEFQMAGMNLRLNPNIETLFLMASDYYQFISSRMVKEIARLQGDVSQFVSENVRKELKKAYSKKSDFS